MKIDKKTALSMVSAFFGIGSVIVGLMSKQNETDEAAEKAAQIVMNKMSKQDQN